MKKNILKAAAAVLICAEVLSVPGCSFHSGLSVGAYVDAVKDNTKEAVNITRELRRKNETLDPRNKDAANDYISSLDQLSEIYSALSQLSAPDHYDDIDDQLKPDAEQALAAVSELKSLVNNAVNTGDDTLYKQSSEKIMEKYEAAYADIVELSSTAATRYRND